MKRNFKMGIVHQILFPVNKSKSPLAEHIPLMGEERYAYRDLVGKSEGKGHLE